MTSKTFALSPIPNSFRYESKTVNGVSQGKIDQNARQTPPFRAGKDSAGRVSGPSPKGLCLNLEVSR